MVRIPTTAGTQKVYGRYYIVQYGDSLYSITQKFNITMANLLKANDHMRETNVITPGEVMFIPSTVPANNKNKGTTKSKKNVRKKKK